MSYPPKEQIKKKTDDFVRMLRLYIKGMTNIINVKNELNCLYIDLTLDEAKKDNDKKYFITFAKELKIII